MAPPLKLIFLVTLLLISLVGSSSADTCQSNGDCPPCDVGVKFCLDGSCSCTLADADEARPADTCQSGGDCPPCDTGDAFCVEGSCSCNLADADVAETEQTKPCRNDNDCAKLCPNCSSYCASSVCICSC